MSKEEILDLQNELNPKEAKPVEATNNEEDDDKKKIESSIKPVDEPNKQEDQPDPKKKKHKDMINQVDHLK